MTSNKTIPPGGEGEIKVTLKPKGKRGPVNKTITVSTNDPANARVALKIKANVLGAVQTDPLKVDFGTVDHGSAPSVVLAAWLREDLEGEITEAKTASPKVVVERLRKADAKGRTQFRVSLAKDAGVGFVRDTISVRSSAAKNPQARVIVSGNIVGDYEYQPRTLSLSQQTGKILVKRRSGKRKLAIVSAEASTAEIGVEVVESKPGEVFEIRIKIAADKPRVRGRVTIKVDNPAQPEFSIPVSFAVRRAPGAGKVRTMKREAKPLGKRIP